MRVSAISFGAWAIGGSWGQVDDEESMRALHAGDRRRRQFHRHRRRLRRRPQRAADRPAAARAPERHDLRRDESRPAAAGADRRGLHARESDGVGRAQPAESRDRGDRPAAAALPAVRSVSGAPRCSASSTTSSTAGKMRYYGVSVETRGRGARGDARTRTSRAIQIIFNMFRLKPAERVLPEARGREVGILARVPLASGLLTGKLRRDTTFAADDHRQFNRHGEAFDKGETFSGVPYDVGLDAVDELAAARARRRDAGAVRPALDPDVRRRHLRDSRREDRGAGRENAAAAALPALSAETMAAVAAVYDAHPAARPRSW